MNINFRSGRLASLTARKWHWCWSQAGGGGAEKQSRAKRCRLEEAEKATGKTVGSKRK